MSKFRIKVRNNQKHVYYPVQIYPPIDKSAPDIEPLPIEPPPTISEKIGDLVPLPLFYLIKFGLMLPICWQFGIIGLAIYFVLAMWLTPDYS